MPFCRNCGSPVDGQFCTKCGMPAAPPAPQPPPAQPYAPQPAPFAPAYVPPPAAPVGAPAPAPVMPPAVEYAPWGTRVAGYLIDSVMVGAAGGIMLLVAMLAFGSMAGLAGGLRPGGLHGIGGSGCCCALAMFPLATLLVGFWNKVYLVAQRGSSIGQGVMKIRVVNAQGQLLTTGQAALRLLAHVGLSLLPAGSIIDLLWPLWDVRRQTLHDKAVDSYVVTNPAG
jgi:uncharacterized RDD family membrane protein YckC